MRREDLRKLVHDDSGVPFWHPVSDAELAELGYVKVGETVTEETWTMIDEVDEADLLSQGYVKLDALDKGDAE